MEFIAWVGLISTVLEMAILMVMPDEELAAPRQPALRRFCSLLTCFIVVPLVGRVLGWW